MLAFRQTRKLGPARIAPLVGLSASTVYRVLHRHRVNRLAVLDRPTGRVIRRYERDRPGELLHVDVKKLGRLRPGGGHRIHGRDSAQHRTGDQDRWRGRSPGYDYVHAAIDDHSRLAYAEVLADERGGSCAGSLRRAGAFFAAYGDQHSAGADRQRLRLPPQPPVPGGRGRAGRQPALLPALPSPDPTARPSGSTAPC